MTLEIGQRFGKWTVFAFRETKYYSNHKSVKIWQCRCDCGTEKSVNEHSLRRGDSKSCRCVGGKQPQKNAKEVSRNELYRRTKNSANKRNIEWNLDQKQFDELTQLNCFYCDSLPIERFNVYISKNGYMAAKRITKQMEAAWIFYNGLDRVDSNKRYDIENIVSCCKWCNYAKHTQAIGEFIDWIERIYIFKLSGRNCIDNVNKNINVDLGEPLQKYRTIAKEKLFKRYQQDAKKRNFCFELSLDLFTSLCNSSCYYCGISPGRWFNPYFIIKDARIIQQRLPMEVGAAWIIYNGIDRLDSSLGYMASNVVPCCRICNLAKNIRSPHEFNNWINLLTQRLEFLKKFKSRTSVCRSSSFDF